MPEQDNDLLHGFQIWLNLPAAEKMKAPAYCELPSCHIAQALTEKGSLVRAIAGDVHVDDKFINGSLPKMSSQPVLLDIELLIGDSVELVFNPYNTAPVYVYQGSLKQGVKQGVFREDINIEILSKLKMHTMEWSLDPDVFSPKEYKLFDVQIELFDHYMFGVLSEKGHELLKKYKTKYEKK